MKMREEPQDSSKRRNPINVIDVIREECDNEDSISEVVIDAEEYAMMARHFAE